MTMLLMKVQEMAPGATNAVADVVDASVVT
jgi:hypothetical protein